MSKLNSAIIKKKISEFLKVPLEKLNDEVELRTLVSNSFILIELIIELQNEFDIVLMQEELMGVVKLSDMIKLLESKAT